LRAGRMVVPSPLTEKTHAIRFRRGALSRKVTRLAKHGKDVLVGLGVIMGRFVLFVIQGHRLAKKPGVVDRVEVEYEDIHVGGNAGRTGERLRTEA